MYRLIMFTSRPNTWRYYFRVSVLTRAGLTTFPWINPAPCERRTVLLLTYCALTIKRPTYSATCGTTALPNPLSLSTLKGTPLATRPTSGSTSH